MPKSTWFLRKKQRLNGANINCEQFYNNVQQMKYCHVQRKTKHAFLKRKNPHHNRKKAQKNRRLIKPSALKFCLLSFLFKMHFRLAKTVGNFVFAKLKTTFSSLYNISDLNLFLKNLFLIPYFFLNRAFFLRLPV